MNDLDIEMKIKISYLHSVQEFTWLKKTTILRILET